MTNLPLQQLTCPYYNTTHFFTVTTRPQQRQVIDQPTTISMELLQESVNTFCRQQLRAPSKPQLEPIKLETLAIPSTHSPTTTSLTQITNKQHPQLPPCTAAIYNPKPKFVTIQSTNPSPRQPPHAVE